MSPTRDLFLAVLATQPLLKGDAIVVLCGEDAEARLATGVELLRQQGGRVIVLSGGRDTPPRRVSATALYPVLLGRGVAPDRILMETGSQHTREQAVHVVALAQANEWKRLLLVVSPYHAPRAYLTFLQALTEADLRDTIHLISVPCADTKWFEPPVGMRDTRAMLYAGELERIAEYQVMGHVASYSDGLDYLRFVEGR